MQALQHSSCVVHLRCGVQRLASLGKLQGTQGVYVVLGCLRQAAEDQQHCIPAQALLQQLRQLGLLKRDEVILRRDGCKHQQCCCLSWQAEAMILEVPHMIIKNISCRCLHLPSKLHRI